MSHPYLPRPSSSCSNNPAYFPRELPVKLPLTVLLLVQLTICCGIWLEASTNLANHSEHFIDERDWTVVFTAFVLATVWFCALFCGVIVLFTNSYPFLIPHIVYSVFLALLFIGLTSVLTLNDTPSWTLLYSMGITVVLIVSVYYETRCYLDMKRYL